MTDRGGSNLALAAMLVWYGALLLGSGAIMLIGMAFGSEVYRDKGIPLEELLMIYGPFLATAVSMGATIYFWNKGRRGAAVGAWAVSVVMLLAGTTWLGGFV